MHLLQLLLEPRLTASDAVLPGTAEGPVRSHGHVSGLAETDQVLLGQIRVALNLRRESQLTKKIQSNRMSGNRPCMTVLAVTEELRDPS